MASQKVCIPDIGTTDAVDVIEICVKPGDEIQQEDTLLVLESDKATVEVPAPCDGVVVEVLVTVGQAVRQNDPIVMVASAEGAAPKAQEPSAASQGAPAQQSQRKEQAPSQTTKPSSTETREITRSETVRIPDLGDVESVEVIEVTVSEGDAIQIDDTLAVLESDKATMEVPSSCTGVVTRVLLRVGDKVAQGSPVVEVQATVRSAPEDAEPSDKATRYEADSKPAPATPAPSASPTPPAQAAPEVASETTGSVHAGPAVRRLARELGVDLVRVVASGPRQRILKEDVHEYVRERMQAKGNAVVSGAASGLPALPDIDFSTYGPVEAEPLSKLRRVAANNLHRSWVHVPHVTQFDHADITDLEAFRKSEGKRLAQRDIKLTLLAFLVKACAAALREFPRFNSSLSADGETLILKQYCHIGIAVDTPNGLVVPVIRDADKLSLSQIAGTLQTLSAKAREKKLTPADMQGGCFSISSLGGIGGTAFTPIVNWPEVAILGVSRAETKPIYQHGEFEPRLMLPLSLSYDHRVIDGADAARFTTWLSEQLADIRRLLL